MAVNDWDIIRVVLWLFQLIILVETAIWKAKTILGEQHSAFPEDAALHHHSPAYHLEKDLSMFLCINVYLSSPCYLESDLCICAWRKQRLQEKSPVNKEEHLILTAE